MEHALDRVKVVTPEVVSRCEKAAAAYLDRHQDVWEALVAKHGDFEDLMVELGPIFSIFARETVPEMGEHAQPPTAGSRPIR